MNWFLAKIVYQIVCGDGNHTPQFDEQVRLISAYNSEEAFVKSNSIGLQEEDVFYNQQQQLVQWKFVGVAELHSLEELSDGAEVYSQIKETDDAESYSRFIVHKASQLQKSCLSLTTQTV
ncbi:MAG: DUF4288 domain-containing protein [Chitinophagaceae bacterium]|nr:MAG: DUF4288 domain-containing protein [Chitinophagaceae bacterium]